jgi:hypothetical protein
MLTLSADDSRRPFKSRDNIDRRRLQEDRRKSPIDMRLRVGLWYQYHRATRAGEFDALPRNQYRRMKIQEALLPEIVKYEFLQRENNSRVTPAHALSAAVDFLWSHHEVGCNPQGESTAVYTINAIAEYLVRTFQVTMIDRRQSDQRSARAAGA